MPYAALHSDCDVLDDPVERDLARVDQTRGLIVFGYRFASLEPLAALSTLRVLKIQGAPALRALDGAPPNLRELVLTTPPGSDGSGRRIEVASFAPLRRLATLQRLVLSNVRPADLDLSPLMAMTHLEEVDVGGVPEFVVEHYARLAAALPRAEGRCLRPYVTIPGIGRCKKCQGQSVLLNGAPPRARKWVCPTCNATLLAAHVSRWEAAAAG